MIFNFIAVDLNSLVKLPSKLCTIDDIFPTITENVELDITAVDIVRYTIKVGKLKPIYIGRASQMFKVDTYSILRHLSNGQNFCTLFGKFKDINISALKYKALDTFKYIEYAYDTTEKDLHIWEENCVEVV